MRKNIDLQTVNYDLTWNGSMSKGVLPKTSDYCKNKSLTSQESSSCFNSCNNKWCMYNNIYDTSGCCKAPLDKDGNCAAGCSDGNLPSGSTDKICYMEEKDTDTTPSPPMTGYGVILIRYYDLDLANFCDEIYDDIYHIEIARQRANERSATDFG